MDRDGSEGMMDTHHGRDQVDYVRSAPSATARSPGTPRSTRTSAPTRCCSTPAIPPFSAFMMAGIYSHGGRETDVGRRNDEESRPTQSGGGAAGGDHPSRLAMEQLAQELGIDPFELRRRLHPRSAIGRDPDRRRV